LLRTTSLRGIRHCRRFVPYGRTLCFCTISSRRCRPRPTKDVSPTGGPDVWDANHDGIYTCDEWKSYLDRMFTLADHNRDGHLDPSEFKVIRQAGATFADADFGYFDENQDGKITRSEFVNKPNEFILQNDKNGELPHHARGNEGRKYRSEITTIRPARPPTQRINNMNLDK
jgi:EF-hand domain pair